jgi:hypothetical protein
LLPVEIPGYILLTIAFTDKYRREGWLTIAI